MNYVAPRRIRYGSKVAIVAPASAVKQEQLVEGLDVIRQCGLKPVLGPCARNVYSEASVQEKVDELHWAFSDPEISAVICALGGVGSAAVLPHLDYGLIRRSRKAFLGRSDITSLNCGLLSGAGLITINGQTPSIHIDEGQRALQLQSQSLMRTLTLMLSNDNWQSFPFVEQPNIVRTISSGTSYGHAIGCNIDTFTHLIGTNHLPTTKGAILFMEDIHKSDKFLERVFLQLKLSGILGSLAGVVIGEFSDLKNCHGEDIDRLIQEYFSDGPPCIYGLPFSHGSIVAPIPIGATCYLDADSQDVSFDFRMQ